MNSNHFVSNHFVSNYFASNHFVSNHFVSNHFVSNHFVSNHFTSNLYYACNSKNMVSSSSMNYLTMVLSFKENSINYYSLPSSSHMPSPMPSLMPSHMPSPMPSFSPDQPLLTFESLLTLSGLSKPELDISAQTSIIIATSKSMNISLNFVKFISQKLATSVAIHFFRILLQSPTYTIVAVTEVTIPLSQTDNPTLIYSSLKTKLLESVGNGNFNTFLVAASIALNSTSTQNAVLLGIEMTDPIQDLKSDSSKKYDAKYLRIFLIVVFSLIGIIVFGIFSIVFRKKCRMNRRNQIELIQLIELNQIQITE